MILLLIKVTVEIFYLNHEHYVVYDVRIKVFKRKANNPLQIAPE